METEKLLELVKGIKIITETAPVVLAFIEEQLLAKGMSKEEFHDRTNVLLDNAIKKNQEDLDKYNNNNSGAFEEDILLPHYNS